MVDVPPESPDADREALAAELALNLLDGTERAQALRLCLSDPAFAAAVEAWSLRLAPLLDAIPYAEPSLRVWNAVEARIGVAAPAPVTNIAARLKAWRAGALAASAVAACLALVIAFNPVQLPRPAPPAISAAAPVAVAQLAGASDAARIAVAYDPKAGLLRVGPQALAAHGKSPELWVIPEDGVPRSLGLLAGAGVPLTVRPALRPFLHDGATLAITMEDPASAPHPGPSGKPVLTGIIASI
ncbi:anti-sigma factor [Novosphingobium sp. Leaf2]|uniref:anti-sigma factor n=1 Tax=Novosphingobium sp. Leaf2 TaxID=1735670 RepID=UPI0006FBA9BE|nr:anti-sigma factor [Novosphingobium sp. Leaf2]KQM18266.1 hypothetical protein ASE49_08550 [Novosphingobium sp. Leaf2]